MYKLFRNIGLITIIIGCFIYNQKLVSVVKEYDDIMIEIKKNMNSFEEDAIDAIIKDKTIIPGINGKEIDIDKSYKNMREYGKYNEKLFVYKTIKPKNSLNDNKDKFIVKGNKKNKVSVIFVNKIDNVINLGNNYNYYITKTWYDNNKDEIAKLIDKKYIFLTNNNKYLKKISGQKNGYCYTENYDEDILNKCLKNGDYTIVPNIILNDSSLLKLEKSIESGSIIAIKTNNYENIIRYIKNKGYQIVSIEELISEG